MFYHPDEVSFLKDKVSIIDETLPSPEKILIRGTFFHTEMVGADPKQVKAKMEQTKHHEEGDFDDRVPKSSLPSSSSVKPLSAEEKAHFRDLLRAGATASPMGSTSKTTSPDSPSVESPIQYAEIRPVVGKSPTSSLAGTSKLSDEPNEGDAKPSTSTAKSLYYPELIFPPPAAGNIESVASTSKTSETEGKEGIELIDLSQEISVKKSTSLGNIGMTSKTIVSPTKKLGLESIDESQISKKSSSLGNFGFRSTEDRYDLIDDSKDLLIFRSSIGPSRADCPDPYKNILPRWRINSVVTRALDLTREDDKDYAYYPIYCGEVLVRKGADQLTIPLAKQLQHKAKDTKWVTKYLLLRNRHLYFANDKKLMYKFYLMSDLEFQEQVSDNYYLQHTNKICMNDGLAS